MWTNETRQQHAVHVRILQDMQGGDSYPVDRRRADVASLYYRYYRREVEIMTESRYNGLYTSLQRVYNRLDHIPELPSVDQYPDEPVYRDVRGVNVTHLDEIIDALTRALDNVTRARRYADLVDIYAVNYAPERPTED